RHKSRPARDIPYVNRLVRQNTSRVHEISVDGDAPFVLEIGVCDGGAMDLRLKNLQPHRPNSLSPCGGPNGVGPPTGHIKYNTTFQPAQAHRVAGKIYFIREGQTSG